MMKQRWMSVGALMVVGGFATIAACTGSTGPAGNVGANGEAGAPGDKGAQGAMGAAGAAGEAGAQGSAGPAGEAGAQGPAGEAGAQGDTGDAGPQGIQGAQGDAGATGASLVISDTAKQGISISPVPINTNGLTSSQLEMIGEGSYLVNALGDCAGCHGSAPNSFLGGGCPTPDAGPPACSGITFATPAFTVTSRNLTPDPGTGMVLTEAQFIDEMRTGADFHSPQADGGPSETMVVMPWMNYRWMSLYDLQSMYAYLQAIPSVSNNVPASTKTAGQAPAPAAFPGFYNAGDQDGGTPLPPETTPTGATTTAPVPDPGFVLRGLALDPLKELNATVNLMDANTLSLFGRGSYLVNAVAECSACHTNLDKANGAVDTADYLTGGQVFDLNIDGVPPFVQAQLGYVRSASANLVGATGFFNAGNVNFATFETLITEGVHAEDPAPQRRVAFPMPWTDFKNLTLGDLEALYTYMHTVATVYGKTGEADKSIPNPAIYCDSTNTCPTGYLCSSTAGGECLHQTCTGNTVVADCAVCQTCSAAGTATGQCQTPGSSLGTCLGRGY
ncbi:MAG: hypothetical protein ACRENE_27165 [Polyangiaceae bacterium]